jgi:hypothetical protein
MKKSDDYLWGVCDCKAGVPAMVGASADYYSGYSDQHSAEQALTMMGLIEDRKMGMKT